MHAPKSRYRRIVQGVLLAGIGVFLHATAYPLIDVIPYDWGRHDDGDWVAARDVAQIAAAIVAFVVLAPAIDEIGNKAWLERWHERYGHIK